MSTYDYEIRLSEQSQNNILYQENKQKSETEIITYSDAVLTFMENLEMSNDQ